MKLERKRFYVNELFQIAKDGKVPEGRLLYCACDGPVWLSGTRCESKCKSTLSLVSVDTTSDETILHFQMHSAPGCDYHGVYNKNPFNYSILIRPVFGAEEQVISHHSLCYIDIPQEPIYKLEEVVCGKTKYTRLVEAQLTPQQRVDYYLSR
jgi:hypothetical protein